MAWRLLVVGAPTVDFLGERTRAGGPGLYVAAAGSIVGCRVHVLGPVGASDAHIVAPSYSRLEAELLGPIVVGCSYRFRHTYREAVRVSSILCRPQGLGPTDIRVDVGSFDAVIIDPVGCEVPASLASLLQASARGPVALDLQGYRRCPAAGSPLLDGYIVVHLSTDDGPPPSRPPRGSVLLYTEGDKGGAIIWSGGIRRLPPPPRILADPTGAGDALLGLTVCLILEGLDPVDASLEAARLVPEALEAAARGS